jgi:hypothetical protein
MFKSANQKWVAEQTAPWFFRIEVATGVQKDGPLIAANKVLAAFQPLFDSRAVILPNTCLKASVLTLDQTNRDW